MDKRSGDAGSFFQEAPMLETAEESRLLVYTEKMECRNPGPFTTLTLLSLSLLFVASFNVPCFISYASFSSPSSPFSFGSLFSPEKRQNSRRETITSGIPGIK